MGRLWDYISRGYTGQRRKRKRTKEKKEPKIIIIMLKGRRTLLVIKCKGNMYHLDSWRKPRKGVFSCRPTFGRRRMLDVKTYFYEIFYKYCSSFCSTYCLTRAFGSAASPAPHPRTNALFRISVNHILL